jgi:hypothetical protein
MKSASRILLFFLMLALPLSFAKAEGIESASGVNLPISAGGNLALTVIAGGGAYDSLKGVAVFSGPIVLGNDPSFVCSPANQGAIHYDSSSHLFLACNGSEWSSLSRTKLATKDCYWSTSGDGRHSSPKCNSGYYLKALAKSTNDEWDGYFGICCNADSSVSGTSYNAVVAQCVAVNGLNSMGKYSTTCPASD